MRKEQQVFFYPDIKKVFDTVSYYVLMDKLMKYGPEKNEQWTELETEGVMNNRKRCSWMPSMKLEDVQKQTEIEKNPYKHHHHHPKFYSKRDQTLKHIARKAAESP